MVRAFAHGEPIARGMRYPVCAIMHIKELLLLIGKSSPCGGSGFPFSLSEWFFIICVTPYFFFLFFFVLIFLFFFFNSFFFFLIIIIFFYYVLFLLLIFCIIYYLAETNVERQYIKGDNANRVYLSVETSVSVICPRFISKSWSSLVFSTQRFT